MPARQSQSLFLSNQSAIVDNKSLGRLLQKAQYVLDKRDKHSSFSVPPTDSVPHKRGPPGKKVATTTPC